jgi:hypothetical protein
MHVRMPFCSSWCLASSSENTVSSLVVLASLSSVIICHHLSSSVIICHHLSSSVIICHHLSSSVIIWHHLASSGIIWHHLSSSVIICHHLSASVKHSPRSRSTMQTRQWMIFLRERTMTRPLPDSLHSVLKVLKVKISCLILHLRRSPLWRNHRTKKIAESTVRANRCA